MDKATNKARGVIYVDRITRETREVRAKTVVLCAQALESTRILFNSARRHDGLAQLERRARPLPDGPHVGRRRRQRRVPRHAGQAEPERRPPAERPLRDPLPQHRSTASGTRTSCAATASRAAARSTSTMGAPGFGQAYKDAVKNGQWTMNLVGFGECLPYKENHVTHRTRTSPTSSASPCCTSTWRGARTRRR